VACSLESAVLGDVQILAQVKDAYGLAQRHGTTGAVLSRAFEVALRAGKHARSTTDIGAGAVSSASAAVALAERRAGPLTGRRVLVIGAGATARLLCRHIGRRRPAVLTIANRTSSRATALAAETGGRTATFGALDRELVAADVVFTATAAPGAIVSAPTMRAVMDGRRGAPLTIVDLGMPRDIDPSSAGVEGVWLRAIDDVNEAAGRSLARRQAAIAQVEQIVALECRHFDAWCRSRLARPDAGHPTPARRNRLVHIRSTRAISGSSAGAVSSHASAS
jgi:glutamyl-tRNA reductase